MWSGFQNFLGKLRKPINNFCIVVVPGKISIVTVRLSLNYILGVKIYTFDRDDRVSGETSVTVCIAVRGIERGK
jgi:hypothetical protein